MSFAVLIPKNRFVSDYRSFGAAALIAAIHVAALAILLWSETDHDARAAFLLTWGCLNFFWLAWLGRPLPAGALSLAFVLVLIMLSAFKHSVVLMTATIVDVMLIDRGTFSFLMAVVPGLAWKVAGGTALILAVLILVWRADPFRVRRTFAGAGCIACFTGLATLSLALPTDREDEFFPRQYVSKFARSAAVATVDLVSHGVFEADASVPGPLLATDSAPCESPSQFPNIVMVFDESSFDITMMPNVVVPTGYRDRFRSLDGKFRSFIVEGAGGPSWYTEYNVLTGLSVRSYGRFAGSVTRLATGHVKRGLPYALRKCGYETYSLYSWFGAFAGARGFHTGTGIEHFLDAKQLRTGPADTDAFYYDYALRVLSEQEKKKPAFIFVYLAANHFPWNYHYRPDLLTDWVNRTNPFEIDEYLRRQEMSARDYAAFKEHLAVQFPGERFLLVRFGDHQPLFAKQFMEPGLSSSEVAERIRNRDPRYFTTYYSLDGVNFQPRDLSSALDPLDAPYLPLVVLEAAGLPLDSAFAEQKKILNRCQGLFYLCSGGAEARRFNRLLINAGMIQGF